ncbi:MAG: hypothetical protein ABIK52_08075 [Bacteroidota bacterium]
MLIRLLILPLLCCCSQVVFSQNDIVIATGEAQVDWTADKSELQVKKEAEDAATINALERAFGRIIIQGNSTYLKNLNTGELVETTTIFNSIANSNVKGEVMEVLDTRFEEIEGVAVIDGKKSKIRAMKCFIRLRAKPVTEETPDFEAYTLDCPDLRCNSSSFSDNDPFFLAFKAPSSGYLSVFLDDGKRCQELLPYRRMPDRFQDGIPITPGKEYIFFSKKPEHTPEGLKDYTDEYFLRSESPMDQVRIFVVFSSTQLRNLTMSEGNRDGLLNDSEQSQGYKLPKETSSEDFQRWLINSQGRKKDLRVMRVDITIAKP